MFRYEEAISHSELTDYMRKLRLISDDGVCHGLAGMGICELLLGEEKNYNKRLDWMRVFWRASNGNPEPLMKQMLPIVNAIDHELIADIPVFLRKVDINYQPLEYLNEFPEKTELSQDLAQTLQVTAPPKIKTIAHSPTFTGAYRANELKLYFAAIAKAIGVNNIALAISSATHTLFAKYDYANKRWLYGNTQKMEIIPLDSHNKMGEHIAAAFGGEATVIGMQFFGLNQYEIKRAITSLSKDPNWNELHKVDAERVNLDCESIKWIHVAAQNDDQISVRKLLDYDPSLKELKTADGDVSLDFAKKERHEVLADFIQGFAQAPRLR